MAENAQHRVAALRALRAELAKYEQVGPSADLEAVRWRALARLDGFQISARDAEVLSSYKHVIARGGVSGLDQVLHTYGFVGELPALAAQLGPSTILRKSPPSSLVTGRCDWMIPLASAPSAVRACAGETSLYALLRDGTLCHIDRSTGETTAKWATTPTRGPRPVFAVIANLKVAVIASGDELFAWDLAAATNIWHAQDSGGRVQAVLALEHDGWFLQWDATGRLTLRETLSGKAIARSPALAPGLRRVCASAIAPSHVIGVGGDGRAYLVRIPELECHAIDLPGNVYDCALSATSDVALFATITAAGASAYAVLEGSFLDAPPPPRWFPGKPADQVSVSPGGEQAILVRAGEHVQLVSTSTGQVERELPRIESFYCDVFLDERECLVAGGELSEIRIFNLKSTRPVPVASHGGLVTGIKLFDSNHCISIANEVVRWELATGQRLETLPLPRGYWGRDNFECVGASRVALGVSGSDVDVMSLTGDAVQRLSGHEGGVARMRASRARTRLATVASGGRVRIWDCTRSADLALVQQLDARSDLGTPLQVDFGAGDAAVVCRYQNGVAVWDLASGTDVTPERLVELGADAAFVLLPKPGLCVVIDGDGRAAVYEGNGEPTQTHKFDEPLAYGGVVADENLVVVTVSGVVHVVSAELGIKWKHSLTGTAHGFDARNAQLCVGSDGRYFGVAQTWQFALFSTDQGLVGSWLAADPITAGLVTSDGSVAVGDSAGNVLIIGRA